MFSRFRTAIGLSLVFALGLAIPVLAGGWAVITLDELPSNVTAGEPVSFGFTVLQHGRTPLAGLEPTVTARSSDGEKIVIFADPEGKPGHYVATFAFSKAGDWEWSVQAFTMDQPMPVLSVSAPSAASPSELKFTEQPRSISPFLSVRILALGIGLVGLALAFRRRSRLAVALTTAFLLVGLGAFMVGADEASSVEAQSQADSDISQVELGRQLFLAKGCVTCHLNRKAAGGPEYWTVETGPDLSKFTASPEVLRLRLQDPSSVKSDTQMPNLNLSTAEIEALVAFINSK